MKILLNGIGGFMGNEVVQAANRGYAGATLVGGIDLLGAVSADVPCAASFDEAKALFPAGTADCLIDFSHHACTKDLLEYCKAVKIPVVVTSSVSNATLNEVPVRLLFFLKYDA